MRPTTLVFQAEEQRGSVWMAEPDRGAPSSTQRKGGLRAARVTLTKQPRCPAPTRTIPGIPGSAKRRFLERGRDLSCLKGREGNPLSWSERQGGPRFNPPLVVVEQREEVRAEQLRDDEVAQQDAAVDDGSAPPLGLAFCLHARRRASACKERSGVSFVPLSSSVVLPSKAALKSTYKRDGTEGRHLCGWIERIPRGNPAK